MISAYPSIYALGHRYLKELLLDPVLVEEKVDGSQFSFGVRDGEVRCRSKGADLNVFAPDKMFAKAVEWVVANQDKLMPGWVYRGEYLVKPKHNVLAYDRVPANHIILFDVAVGPEDYVAYDVKQEEADKLGLELVPRLYEGRVEDVQTLRAFLERVSCLGGQKIEGMVVKNYGRFGIDKRPLMGKFVSEAFKEVHNAEWKAKREGPTGVIEKLIETYKSPARWQKAIQHLRERGQIEDTPKDIGLLFKEVPADIRRECEEAIKDKLFEWAWPNVQRGVMAGLPEWYKQQLLERQFNHDEGGEA